MLTNKLTGAGAADKTYIEDVFSTYLYKGTGASSQTINNGIDLAGKGGLVWTKSRSYNADNILIDTINPNNWLISNSTGAAITGASTYYIPSFTSTGYNIAAYNYAEFNNSSHTYASWTFRKAPKFFDVVTWTGDGATSKTISHGLGQVPGFIIVKNTLYSGTQWYCYHTSLGATKCVCLNSTDPAFTAASTWNNTEPTSSNFTVGSYYNASGSTYVAYLFAHDTTTDGLIQCGSGTSAGTTNNTYRVELGWEPQYLLIKRTDGVGDWWIFDTMRGLTSSDGSQLKANLSDAESAGWDIKVDSTGFNCGVAGYYGTYIYMAIRRGPMKTPTDATKVFAPVVGTTRPATITTNIVTDMQMSLERTSSFRPIGARLMGNGYLQTNQTAIYSGTGIFNFALQNQIYQDAAASTINYAFRRAPGFFDVVCYTGTGSPQNISHNLGVIPELMIVKNRSATSIWAVFAKALGADQYLRLNTNDSSTTNTAIWNNTLPTTTAFSVYSNNATNMSGSNHVAYLFASCPGVSKVGTYTGNGSSQTINCGFTNGARFVLIKKTDGSGGNWWVFDTARGITAGNDPWLLLNSTSAEGTSDDVIDPNSTGFTLDGGSALNESGGSYIYLAIA